MSDFAHSRAISIDAVLKDKQALHVYTPGAPLLFTLADRIVFARNQAKITSRWVLSAVRKALGADTRTGLSQGTN